MVSHKKSIHLWFKSLTVMDVIYIMLLSLRNNVTIFSENASKLSIFICNIFNINIEYFIISLSQKDAKGANIWARAEDLVAVFRNSLLQDPGDYSWLPKDQRAFGVEWQRFLASHCYEQSLPLCQMYAYVENYYQSNDSSSRSIDKIIINYKSHKLARYISNIEFSKKISTPIVINGHGDSLTKLIFMHISQVLWRLYYLAKRQIRHRLPEVCVPLDGKGILIIQYEKGMLERGPLGATYDWVNYSGIPSNRIVFYVSRSDTPLDEDLKTVFKKHGYGWAEYYNPDNYLDQPLWTGLRFLFKSLTLLPKVRSYYDIWRWQVVASSLPRIEAHRHFMRKYNVLAIHQHMEFLPYLMMQVMAARQEDVMFIWGLWSVLIFRESWYGHAIADLLQCWGGIDQGFMNTVSCDYRYAMVAGILGYDGSEPDDQQRATEIRSRLNNTTKFVITLFDSSHTKGGKGNPQSSESCAYYYRVMLELVLKNPDWGCLIKSKNAGLSNLTNYPELQEMLDELTTQGRASVLPWTTKPSLALWSSDAAVCFSVNSAGFLSAVRTGRPVLHFDLDGLTMHPMFTEAGLGKIIFQDAESLTQALNSISKGEGLYGDMTPWKHLFDSFQDGLGRLRTGKVMGDYVAARDRQLSMADALRESLQTYANTYGDEFVTTRHETHDGPGERLWQKVERLHYPNRTSPLPFTNAALSTQPIRAKRKPAS